MVPGGGLIGPPHILYRHPREGGNDDDTGTASYSTVTPTTRQLPPSRTSDSVSIAPALFA